MSVLETGRPFDGEVLRHRLLHLDPVKVLTRGMKEVLSLVILTLLIALVAGVLKTFGEIRLLIDHSVEVVLRQIIADTVMLLALGAVFNTTLTCFREGRVKMTSVVDTILVVMLTAVISQWSKGENGQPLTVLCGIVLILSIMRVVAVRWSPTPNAG